MLTGRRAFEGEDVSSIMAAVIQSEPRWDGVPASVRRLLESCLEKDPKKRLRDIGDVWKLLDDQPAIADTNADRRPWLGSRRTACAPGGGGAVGAVARDAGSCRAASPTA